MTTTAKRSTTRKTILATVVPLVLLVALTACTPTENASAACLDRAIVVDVNGAQDRFPTTATARVDDNYGVDARDATWNIDHELPVVFGIGFYGETRNNVCIVGGEISSPLPHETTTWSTWHSTTALTVRRPNFQVLKTWLTNVGDGINFSTDDATDWTIRGVRMDTVHDDCVSNDYMHSGLVDDSLFDGCYVFYSARGPVGSTLNGSAETVTVTNSLIRLEPMPFTYTGSRPGNGPFLKLAGDPTYGRSPNMVMRNNVIRMDQAASHGNYRIPGFDHDKNSATADLPYLSPANCSNNTIVWFGSGPFPDPLPSCFTITEDRNVWYSAVAKWETAHPDLAD